MADADQVTVKMVEESTYGTTPTNSPNWKALRITGESLNSEPQTEQSEELPGTQKGIVDIINSGENVSGDVSFELSAVSFDDLMEAVLQGTWAANVLTDGNTERSFSLEKHYGDINQYMIYKGMVATGFSLSIQKKTKITGNATFSGASSTDSGSTAVGTGSVLAVNEKPLFRSGSTISNIQIDDTNVATLGVRIHGIDFNAEISSEAEDTVDSDSASGVSTNDIKFTASISAYFDNLEIKNKLKNTTAFKLEFTLADSDGNSYAFEFPRCKFESGSVDGASKGSQVNISADAVATVDKTAGYAIKITRVAV